MHFESKRCAVGSQLILKARAIMNTVRAFYAGHGPKSNNKVYMESNKDMITNEEFEGMRWRLMVSMSAKAKMRNRHSTVSDRFRWDWSSRSEDTHYKRGEAIWRAGASGAVISGNCMEMAFVSAYLAIKDYNVSPRAVWFVSIGAPGDHAFCLVGPSSKPAWRTVKDMETVSVESVTAVVIDPWLHVASLVMSYPTFAQQTLKKWHTAGKRVFWSGADYDGSEASAREGWYDPDGTYARSFLVSPVTISRVT
jgi:hypothetical protein